MPKRPKIYLAAPFFNPEQIALVEKLEALLSGYGVEVFSPRNGENALEMNALLSAHAAWEADPAILVDVVPEPPMPDEALRYRVFTDNVVNIDDADLVLAVIDDRDTGVVWEMGYAFARHVPVAQYTARGYGSNLMLAHSIVAHLKSTESLCQLLEYRDKLTMDSSMAEYGEAIAEIQQIFRGSVALKEGPDEHQA